MLIATIAFATALFSIIHHHPAPISMPARMRAALLIPHAANTLTALHNQHGHASLCPPRQQFDCKLEQSTPVTPLYCHSHCSLKMYSQNSAAFFTAKFEFSFSKASCTRLQQQAAASSSKQQTHPAAPPPANASRLLLQSCVLKRGLPIEQHQCKSDVRSRAAQCSQCKRAHSGSKSASHSLP